MSDLYQVVIRDKLAHIVQQLQRNLMQSGMGVSLHLPVVANLQELTIEDVKKFKFMEIQDYESMKMVFQLKLKLDDNGVVAVIGASRRNWFYHFVKNKQKLKHNSIQICNGST